MPILLVGARNDQTNEPIVWYCSDCEEAFEPPRVPYTLQDLWDIDRRFREHSKLAHSGAPVISLELPLGDG